MASVSVPVAKFVIMNIIRQIVCLVIVLLAFSATTMISACFLDGLKWNAIYVCGFDLFLVDPRVEIWF
jgi:hypothetical protein